MGLINTCSDLVTNNNGARGRARELLRELTSNPFFPLLFIGEATKLSAFSVVGAARPPVVGVAWAMALLSVIAWLYSYDEVKWGLHQAKEAVEEATDEDNT